MEPTRAPAKPVLPPMPPPKEIMRPYHPPYQAPYHPYHHHRHHRLSMPCDPRMLHHMYRHMKMCHRYETYMMRWYIRCCKSQWRHRQYRPHESSSSRYRRESSSSRGYHESQY